MNQYWQEILKLSDKYNNKNIISNDLFEYFINFMIKETSIEQKSTLKELSQNAMNKKMEGNNYFKQNKFDLAIQCYKDALYQCPKKKYQQI